MTRTLDAIARPSGALAMVAMDQRESLRHMFDQAGAGRPGDATLVDFKLAVARALSPLASGFLIDREYGVERAAPLLPPTCGLILAADALEQEPGGPVEETALDEAVVAPEADLHGAVAIKLLVLPVGVLLGGWLVGLDPAPHAALLLMAALPTAPSAHILAAGFGADPRPCATVIAQGTVLAALTLPFWMAVALRLMAQGA